MNRRLSIGAGGSGADESNHPGRGAYPVSVPASDTPGARIETAAPSAEPAPRAVLCPYCGGRAVGGRCGACGGLLDPLSVQATQNEMGPWFIHDDAHPHRPGCSYETLARLVERGRVTAETVMRGPTTRQFWSFARNVRGVSHLLGECYACHEPAGRDEYMCRSCGAVFEPVRDRQHFGAGAIRLLPGQAPPEIVARSARAGREHATGRPTRAEAPRPTEPAPALRFNEAALTRARRQIQRSRRLVTLSIAVNVVLLASVLIVSLAPRLAGRAGRGAPPIPSGATPTEPAPDQSAAAQPDEQAEADLTVARQLIDADTFESLRAAERLLTGPAHDGDEAGEAAALLQRCRERLDAKSLEALTGATPSAPQAP